LPDDRISAGGALRDRRKPVAAGAVAKDRGPAAGRRLRLSDAVRPDPRRRGTARRAAHAAHRRDKPRRRRQPHPLVLIPAVAQLSMVLPDGDAVRRPGRGRAGVDAHHRGPVAAGRVEDGDLRAADAAQDSHLRNIPGRLRICDLAGPYCAGEGRRMTAAASRAPAARQVDPRRYHEAVDGARTVEAQRPPVCLYLETTNRCNLLCTTCPRTYEELEPPADM